MSSFLTNRTAKNSISKNLTVSDTNTNNIICNTIKVKQLPNNAFVKTDNSSQLKTDKIYISDIDDINILQTDPPCLLTPDIKRLFDNNNRDYYPHLNIRKF